jgi:tetratricopeptide (TPR) repeat protein
VILRSPGETLEGSELLDEIGGGPGVLLWRALRAVTLWAGRRPRGRGPLFAPGARERWLRDVAAVPAPEPLCGPLRALASLLAAPGGPAGERTARACAEISGWAAEAGAPLTALAFAQAAALAAPERAPAALAMGLRAAEAGQEIRAEGWLRRAVVLARAARDRATQAHASLHLAGILARRGERERAARAYRRAERLAARCGLPGVRAEALRAMRDGEDGGGD